MIWKILDFWRESDAFQQSISSRPEQLSFKFYDGPPFASGDPHYGHLLASTLKDIVPRYMTMRGYRVERKRWRDCHGLPAENYVEKQLGIQGRKEIEEKVGVETFVESCRNAVIQVNDNWKRFVDHLGRWVDIDNAYFTMSQDFMESVIWVFSQMYNKNLIYKGFKIQGYCPNCATPLSNYEITQWYADKQSPTVTVKFKLQDTSHKPQANSWTLKIDEEEKYQMTEDGFIDVVSWVVRDGDKYCLLHHAISGNREWPWGKVEDWETFENALEREVKEEFGITMTGSTYLWNVKAIYCEKKYRFHYFDVEYRGTPELLEEKKHHDLQRVEVIDDDNEIGFVVRIDGTIIDDIDDLRRNFITLYYTRYLLKEEKITTNPSVHLLARTTTPWTLPANMFIAVGEDLDYVMIYDRGEKEYYILGEQALWKYYKNTDDYIFVYRIKGKELVGLSYAPLFDYFYTSPYIDSKYYDKVHKVLAADFITTDDGTGIAHEAPAFGEDDYQLVIQHLPQQEAKDWLFHPVDEFGAYTNEITEWQGINVFEANKEVIKAIKEKGKLVHQGTIDHSYPHCWRCDTPLLYKAIDGWFIKEPSLKEELMKSAENIRFVPAAIKKRFINGLEWAPDRNISRNRFRGSPIPVWECEACNERVVCGTVEEIETLSGQKVKDLHKPYIDKITIPCKQCGKDMKRTPEVLDCWFESWAMPYGQDHYLGEKSLPQTPLLQRGGQDKLSFDNTADFIAEGLDQTRGWFRTLHVIWQAIDGKPAFKNVIVNGMILAEDGKKMSKRLKNYPDPKYLLEQYGADAFRLYVLWSPVVKAEPLRFMEHGVEQMMKDFVLPLKSVWNFFTMYAKVDNRKSDGTQVYYIRHAEKARQWKSPDEYAENIDIALSETGKKQLISDDFIENILRVNPDIIISSDCVRSQETAKWVQNILKDFVWKDVEIVVRDDLVQWFSSETAQGIYQDIINKYTWKTILLVSHAKRFEILWNSFLGQATQERTLIEKNLKLLPTQIIKLPVKKFENELDQWILAETYRMIDKVDTYLQGYELEPATKALIWLMDKLTNRYLRRSRRRFRAEGMDADKQAAYRTLFEVLWLYCKIAAPFTPFVTEWVWQKMQAFQSWKLKAQSSKQNHSSLHLAYRPLTWSTYINQDLMDEVATVRKIIKWAMYLRSRHQIKVKQPLQGLKFKL